MSKNSFILDLRKESFKFSCSHFTIFSADRAERLHGHNYYVRCQVHIDRISQDLGMAFDFNLIKPVIKNICEHLDEYVLIPKLSPYLKIAENGGQVKVQFGQKSYAFPKDDVRILPIANVTSEELARWIAESLSSTLKNQPPVLGFKVSVEETHGQAAHYLLSFDASERSDAPHFPLKMS